MKLKLLICLLSLYSFPALASSVWHTDLVKAASDAKNSNRFLLLNFTGSDWCGWCIRLEKEVFSQEAFQNYAEKSLVLVKLDFPRKVPISDSLKKQNQSLMEKYGIRGFPTILLLDPSEKLVGRTGYQPGGPEAYINHVQSIIDSYREGK